MSDKYYTKNSIYKEIKDEKKYLYKEEIDKYKKFDIYKNCNSFSDLFNKGKKSSQEELLDFYSDLKKYGIDYASLRHPSITRKMIVEEIEKLLGKNANLDNVQSDKQLTGRRYDASTSWSPVSDAGVIYEWNRGVIAVDSEGREEKENLDKKFFSHHVDATIRVSRRLGSIIGETESPFEAAINATEDGLLIFQSEGDKAFVYLPDTPSLQQIESLTRMLEPRKMFQFSFTYGEEIFEDDEDKNIKITAEDIIKYAISKSEKSSNVRVA